MKETRIVESQQRAEDRILFVSGTRNCIEALVLLLQFASGDIEETACKLVFEDFKGSSGRKSAPRMQGVGRCKSKASRLGSCQIILKPGLDDFNAGYGRSHNSQGQVTSDE